MVSVICNLIIQFPRLRIHPVQPIQSPLDFIDNVRNTIRSLVSIRIIRVTECLRILLIGKKHLINGIGRSRGVLQIVGSIVPSATDIQALTCLGGMIDDISIMHMATVFRERIISATLLAHVVQQEISRTIIYLRINRETWRNRLSGLQIIHSRNREITEVQSVSTFHVPDATCFFR